MKEILKKFKNQKIAVIGDLILDKYIYGEVTRISSEAPVPIVKVLSEKYVPGGAANVAANIASLGGKAFLFGVVGPDQHRDMLKGNLEEMQIDCQGILTDETKLTTLKTRVIGLNQQLLRIDHENTNYIETHFEEEFINRLKEIENLSAIIISDYAKGTITEQLISEIKNLTTNRNIPIVIDPKPKHKNWYKGAAFITPNKKEAQEMSRINLEKDSDFLGAGKKLVEELNSNVIITAGSKGMYVFVKGSESVYIPTVAREVYDVSGAGDTVIATLALALSSGSSLVDAAILANQAAGIKVGKSGTAVVTNEELLKKLDSISSI